MTHQDKKPAGAPPAPDPSSDRLISLDAYRGLTMLLMVSAADATLRHLRNHPTWGTVADQLSHREWIGCTIWDLIQPSFMFIVGVAMPFSFAKREAEGQGWLLQLVHAIKRSILLILIGVFLDWYAAERPYFQLIRVLQQIAIGYLIAFFVLHLGPRIQALTALFLLAAHTGAYIIYGQAKGVDPWIRTITSGTYNTNVGTYLDWLLGLPLSPGHYVTFNAISAAATILFGVLAGELLQSGASQSKKLGILLLAGVGGLAFGWALSGGDGWIAYSFTPLVPMIKRLWTSSFTIYAAGWTCLFLAAFYLVVDVWRYRAWTFPFVVVGMNSILIYVLAGVFASNFRRAVNVVLAGGEKLAYDLAGLTPVSSDVRPILVQAGVIGLEWLCCSWLYRRGIFLRV